MAVREILKMGDPRLLRVAEPVTAFGTPELDSLIADMFDTMHAANGAGLAAPQIGVALRAFSYNVDGEIGYVLNIRACATKAWTSMATRSGARSTASMRGWCSTKSITCSASCIRCGYAIFPASVSPR